jgi:PPP family 3-phenylpropionic acid transporter
MRWVRLGALPAFILLYATMYAAFGAASPFWPRFFETRGLTPGELGLLLGLGTLVRLVAGPLVGRAADMTGALRIALAICAAAAATIALGLLTTKEFGLLLLIHMCQAAALAPTTTLADALAVDAAMRAPADRFEYGWVRGAASAAFIAGTLAAGQIVSATDLSPIVWMHAALLACAVLATTLVPGLSLNSWQAKDAAALPCSGADERPGPSRAGATASAASEAATDSGTPALVASAARRNAILSAFAGVRELFGIALFRRTVLVGALISGSHAMHDTFAVIRWNAAGIGSAPISLLWSASVAAEVVVFFWIGPSLIHRFGPSGAAAIAAVAGTIRWIVMSQTAAIAVLALVQPLHGFTFALLHLASMRLIAVSVPSRLAATSQALYAFGVGGATALTMLLSGPLYEQFGAQAFLLMALLCVVAFPLTFRLRMPPAPR